MGFFGACSTSKGRGNYKESCSDGGVVVWPAVMVVYGGVGGGCQEEGREGCGNEKGGSV